MTVSSTVAASPYKGLVPFGDSDVDALFFFGREHDVDVITANLLAARLTVLYGPTGVGKTSVLRAGVARSLRGGAPPRAVVVMDSWLGDPAPRLAALVAEAAAVAPRASLAETLFDAGTALDGELYVVLDQFEEYFVYHGGRAGAGSFVDELAEVLTRSGLEANVLLCLREDALAKLDVLKTRVPALFSNYLRLDHLTREAARAAVVGPVERWNDLFAGGGPMAIEPALVEAVLDQAGGDRIEASYLQLVLERLWEVERSRGSHSLRLATLTELGGSASVVADHLERALRGLAPSAQVTAAALFHQLVTPSGSKIAHTSRDLARYAGVDEQDVRTVADELVAERILRPADASGGEPRVEIFHDVLAPAVLDWSTRFEAQREEAAARRRLEERHRRWVILSLALLAGLVAMAAVAVYALAQRSEARAQARHARASELTSRALLLETVDPSTALADALAAARLEATQQTEEVLRSALRASRLRRALPTGSPVSAVAWTGAGRVAVGGADGRVRLWDTTTDRVVRTLSAGAPTRLVTLGSAGMLLTVGGGAARLWDPALGRMLLAVRASAPVVDATLRDDGRVVATASADGVELRRVATGALLGRIAVAGSRRVLFSPDGTTLAVVRVGRGGEVTASTFDASSGRRLARLPQRGVSDLAFSPHGGLLATASADGTVALWRPRTGRRVGLLDDGGAIRSLAFDPAGRFLATGSSDGGVRVWRVADRSRFFLFLGHLGGVDAVGFSPDGTNLVSSSDDHTARVWRIEGVEAGKLAAVLAGSRGVVATAAFSPGGDVIVTGGADGVARIWAAPLEQRLEPVGSHPTWVDAVKPLPDGRLVVAGGPGVVAISSSGTVARAAGRVVVLRQRSPDSPVTRVAAPDDVTALGFRADGDMLAVAAGRTVLLWDVPAGRVAARFGVEPGITAVTASPNGRLVATGDDTGAVRLWAVDGTLRHVLRRHRAAVTDVRFDAAGARLVSSAAGASDNAALWDVNAGRLLHALVGHFGTVTAASFSSDGRWIVTAGPTTAGIWSSATGLLLFYVREPPTAPLLTDAEWAPSGYRLVTSDRSGGLRAYRCTLCEPPRALARLAQERIALAR